MKRFLSLLLILPLLSAAQSPASDTTGKANAGIQWTTGLTWEQIKAKAKAENKYIFIDAYTTWCGPCKQMDKQVYPNDTAGNYFNPKFISVKVQFDKTAKDNEDVKKWYGDVGVIEKQYRVTGFPTYIFLSPQGKWVHNATGYQPVAEFIKTAKTALQPGRVYIDPNEDYYKMVKDYEQGNKDYTKMPYMRMKAIELNEWSVAKPVSKDYNEYLTGLNKEELHTKEILEFLASTYIPANSNFFSLFYPDGRRADKMMNQKDFAARVVDNTIKVEMIGPFYKNYNFTPVRMFGGKLDSSEADWKKLYRSIRKNYKGNYADRNVLDARVKWYETKQNWPAFLKSYFLYLEKYGIDTLESQLGSKYHYNLVNLYCWVVVFEKTTDKRALQKALKAMEKVLSLKNDCAYMDTYANLLYKLGKTKEALEWQERALQLAIQMRRESDIKNNGERWEKMKKGKPTWPVENEFIFHK